MNKTLQLTVSPEYAPPHSFHKYTPTEYEHMIHLGCMCVDNMKQCATVDITQEIKAGYETQLADLQVINKYLRETPDTTRITQLETMHKHEVELLQRQLMQLQTQLQTAKTDAERKMEREIQRERDISRLMIQEKDKMIQEYKTLSATHAPPAHKSTSDLGSEGEKVMEEMCRLAFRDFDEFEIVDVHTQKSHGDRHLRFKEFVVLADAKKYNTPVPSTERQKIRDDLMKNDHIHFAWLISLDTPISKYDKGVFAFEWVSEDKCVCYVNQIAKHNSVEVLRSLYFVCKLIYENIIVRKETTTIHQGMLEIYKKEVISNLEKYKTVKKERDGALRKLSEVLSNQDEIIRVMLNQATSEYANAHLNAVMEWVSANVTYPPPPAEGGGVPPVLTSKSMWAKFKKDCPEHATTTTIDQFKDTLMINMEGCSRPKGKDGVLEIHGACWKQPVPAVVSAPAKPTPTTSTKKQNVLVIQPK